MTMLWRGKASAAHASPGFFRFLTSVVLATILAPNAGPAQHHGAVRTIVVLGNRNVAASTIVGWMETKQGSSFIPSDVARIDSGLAESGFPLGRVDSIRFRQSDGPLSSDLLVYVREGKPARFDRIALDGAKTLERGSVLSGSSLQTGELFTPRTLEQGIGKILERYEAAGFPFAKVEVVDLRFREDSTQLATDVTLRVEEGNVGRLSELRAEGNTTTNLNVITRAARFSPGDPYTADLPVSIKRRLDRLQIFSSVSTPELTVNSDRSLGLLVRVVEGNPNRFDGIVGYVPSNAAGVSGYVTGFVDVQFRNIFGTARRLSARWNRETQTTQEIALRYREPWIASLPLSGEGGYSQRKQDSTFVRESYDLSLETTLAENMTVGVLVTGASVTPSEGFGRNVVAKSSTTSIGASLAYDGRDDPVTPTSGLRYQTEYHTGRKEILAPIQSVASSRSSTQKLTFDVEHYLSLVRHQVLAVQVAARDFRTSAVELGDLFRLGGATTLRGYREGEFLGSTIAWANLEYRVLAGQRSLLFAFADVGYAYTPDRKEVGLVKSEIHRTGYGAGVRLDTPLGLIGLSLAFGEGDTFGTAKLHVRLINEF